LEVGGQKGLRRESGKPFAVNADFLFFLLVSQYTF
jgi:hypothetical protein